jgi:hypothetical protein
MGAGWFRVVTSLTMLFSSGIGKSALFMNPKRNGIEEGSASAYEWSNLGTLIKQVKTHGFKRFFAKLLSWIFNTNAVIYARFSISFD